MSNNYGKHPSQKLQEVFSRRPFQLQEPEKAKFIILGLDANWDKDIEKDRKHPTKKNRPLASGAISKRSAVFCAVVLLLIIA